MGRIKNELKEKNNMEKKLERENSSCQYHKTAQRQTDKQKDRETDRHTDRQTDKQADKQG